MGSKSRIAKHIVPIIQRRMEDYNIKTFIDCFCGGCNIIDKVKCNKKIASDNNEFLISCNTINWNFGLWSISKFF